MTFDGKTEKFELFEDLFHTLIKMQPTMTEQMKINPFHSLLKKESPTNVSKYKLYKPSNTGGRIGYIP